MNTIWGGGCIAFVCAAVAVGTDAQTEVRSRFGSLYGTSILRTLPGVLFVVGWGIVDVGFYAAFLSNHDWAKRAFAIDVEQNLLWTGLVVGLSAVLIIRTNLATVGSFQVGGELAYTASRSFLIDRLNRKRGRVRRKFLGGYTAFCEDTRQYPKYFSSLEETLLNLAKGSAQQSDIKTQLATIKGIPPNPDDNQAARRDLTGLVYDYFGPTEVALWAKDSNYGKN